MDKHQIMNLEIGEISLVDDPANDDARVVIVKARAASADDDNPDDEGNNDMTKSAEPVSSAKVASAILTALTALSPQIVEKALAEGFSANPDAAAKAAEIVKETIMDLTELSKALEKAEGDIATLTKRATDAEDALKVANETIAKANETIAKAKEQEKAEPTEEEIYKSLPESVRKRLDAAKETEAALAKMASDKEEADAIAKARDLKVPEPEKVGPLLVRVAKGKTTADDAKVIETLLKQNAAVMAASPLFKSIGSAAAVDGDPEEILKAKAVEIEKASGGKLTYAQAYDEALKQNPAVYQAYQIAKRRAAAE